MNKSIFTILLVLLTGHVFSTTLLDTLYFTVGDKTLFYVKTNYDAPDCMATLKKGLFGFKLKISSGKNNYLLIKTTKSLALKKFIEVRNTKMVVQKGNLETVKFYENNKKIAEYYKSGSHPPSWTYVLQPGNKGARVPEYANVQVILYPTINGKAYIQLKGVSNEFNF